MTPSIPPQYEVKCDECRQTIRTTTSVRESAAGGFCDDCKPKTHGEAYASNYNGYRDRLDAMTAKTKPIHAEVARLQREEGLSGEQAWAQVLAQVKP